MGFSLKYAVLPNFLLNLTKTKFMKTSSGARPVELSGLANLLIAVTGRIEKDEEGKFIIPSDLLAEIRKATSTTNYVVPRDQDVRNFVEPREALRQLAVNAGLLPDQITRGVIRNAYLHILRNGVSDEAAISPTIINGFERWIKAKTDNEVQITSAMQQLGGLNPAELMARFQAGDANLNALLDGMSTEDVFEFVATAKSQAMARGIPGDILGEPLMGPFLQRIELAKSSGSAPVVPTNFLQGVKNIIKGSSSPATDDDIGIMLGKGTTFVSLIAKDNKISEERALAHIRKTYLDGLRNGVDESGKPIDKEIVSGLENWINTRQSAAAGASSSSSYSRSSSSSVSRATPATSPNIVQPQQPATKKAAGAGVKANPYANAFGRSETVRSKSAATSSAASESSSGKRVVILMCNGSLPDAYKKLEASLAQTKQLFGSKKLLEDWRQGMGDVVEHATTQKTEYYQRLISSGIINNIVDHYNKNYRGTYQKDPAPDIETTSKILDQLNHMDLWTIAQKKYGAEVTSQHVIEMISLNETISLGKFVDSGRRIFGRENVLDVDGPARAENVLYPEESLKINSKYIADAIRENPDSLTLVGIDHFAQLAPLLSDIKDNVLFVYPYLGPAIKPKDASMREPTTLYGVTLHSFDATKLSPEAFVAKLREISQSVFRPIGDQYIAKDPLITVAPAADSLPNVFIAGDKAHRPTQIMMERMMPFFARMGYSTYEIDPSNVVFNTLPTVALVNPRDLKHVAEEFNTASAIKDRKILQFAINQQISGAETIALGGKVTDLHLVEQTLEYAVRDNMNLARSNSYKRYILDQSTAQRLSELTGKEFRAYLSHDGKRVDAILNADSDSLTHLRAKDLLAEKQIPFATKTLKDGSNCLVVEGINDEAVARKIVGQAAQQLINIGKGLASSR